MSSIYISHGDKGGIGKSYISSIITDYLLTRRNAPLLAIDGDISQDGATSNADYIARFANHPMVYAGKVPLNNPRSGVDAIYRLMQSIADLADKTDADVPDIIINTPANFSHTFNRATQEMLMKLANDFGLSTRIVYIVGQTSLARSSAMAFIGSSIYKGEDIVIGFPLKDCPIESWMSSNGVAEIIQSGQGFFIPRMSDELAAIYDGNPDKSLATFFGGKTVKDLPLKDKLKYRMIEAHLNEVFPILEKHVIR